ncbi:MAG: heme o synthase [Solirubrobacteraceae bacterium]
MDASSVSQVASGAAAQVPSPAVASGVRQVVADYFELTKPKVQTLLLFTTITTMEIAGSPPVSKIALTCLGGYLSAGGAGAVNHYYDRDIDAQMKRTATRPIPAGRISPRAALIFGFVLCGLSFALLSLTVNLLAASLALAGFVGYVGIYTIWLKRRSPQNIVIGGAAGAVPPLVGWAATRGSLSWTAVYLFAIVFYWTPPHFWSLSLLMKEEYANVGVPMMPVVRGERETRRQIVLYTLLLYAVTQLPFCAGEFGIAYLFASIVLGLAFIAGALWLYRQADRRTALRLYLFSLAYLALLFGAMVADVKL